MTLDWLILREGNDPSVFICLDTIQPCDKFLLSGDVTSPVNFPDIQAEFERAAVPDARCVWGGIVKMSKICCVCNEVKESKDNVIFNCKGQGCDVSVHQGK